ncbi:MAG: hypothetical protein CME71_03045 [Halobacteriovorax sp.]|nr:hypothetical protein [Halobacteriovorax sp.]
MKHLIFLLVFFPLTSIASDCSDYQFVFNIEQTQKTKSLKLCLISPISKNDFVSPACLNSKCKQLKPRKVVLAAKRKGLKAHPGVELCKELNGQYISGVLSPLKKNSSISLCFFSDGNIISSGYLYSNWKAQIRN